MNLIKRIRGEQGERLGSEQFASGQADLDRICLSIR